MCGINGVYAYGSRAEPVDVDEVRRVRDTMRSRGPDGSGIWLSKDGRVGLGHQRLSIIDLSEAGRQPMTGADGHTTIVFNGEIYNYQALRHEMESVGRHFRSNSDTEVILALYRELGVEMLSRLRGMFAFAIWDDEKRRLLLARDALGIKPLYFSNDGSSLRFASQVKALLQGGRVNTSPDPAGHVGFLIWGHVPGNFTLYRGISALPPGSFLVATDAGVVEQTDYIDVRTWFQADDPGWDRSGLRSMLEDTVRHHLVSDVPVDLFLSAGRDSCALLALASSVRAEPLQTTTLAFKEYRGTNNDESRIAAEVARLFGSPHSIQEISSSEFERDLANFLAVMDQPTIDGANTYLVCKVAADAGIKVALSGLGADELFGGYPSFTQIPQLTKRLGWSARFPRMGIGVRRAASLVRQRAVSPKMAGLFEYGSFLTGAYLLRRAVHMPWEIPGLVDPDFAAQGLKELAVVDRLEESIRGLKSVRSKIAVLELTHYMRDRLLRDSDWASMAHSLELRVPFVDKDLIARLAPSIDGISPPNKADLAECPAKALPDSVLNRPKTGFNVPIGEWSGRLTGSKKKQHSLREWSRYLYRQSTGGETMAKHLVERA